MNRQRFNLTLAPRTVATLREVGNASRYIDAVIAQRDRRWRRALRALKGDEFTLAEIRAGIAVPGVHARTLTGRRLAVLAEELAAGNDELHRALNDPDAPVAVQA